MTLPYCGALEPSLRQKKDECENHTWAVLEGMHNPLVLILFTRTSRDADKCSLVAGPRGEGEG